MEYIEAFGKLFVGNIGVFFLIIIAYKVGLLEFLKEWKKNGNDRNNVVKIQKELEEVRDNHLHTLGEKIDKLILKEDEGNLISREILFILKEIRNK